MNTTSTISHDVLKAISLFENGDIPALQDCLYRLYSHFNRYGGGRVIVQYPDKDKLGECFCLCLIYDWVKYSDVREVWAEDGFFCVTEHLLQNLSNPQELIVASLNLFNLLHYGANDLVPKFGDILTKASIVNNHIFSHSDIVGGPEYLIREFKFFAATLLTPFVSRHPQIISPSLKADFERSKTDFCFAVIPVEQIIAKIQFISRVIKSILNGQ